MSKPRADFDLVDLLDINRRVIEAYFLANMHRSFAVLEAEGVESALKFFHDVIFPEALADAERQVHLRAAGTQVFGMRALRLAAQERAIAEALSVRPKLSMVDVAKRAGISRAALYRALARRPRQP